jgi:hypothetical protein
MNETTVIEVVDGFSPVNRWLLYASLLLTPAQLIGGVGNNLPINIGFLGYNWWTQIKWYHSVQNEELHALSLIIVYFNFIYTWAYIAGVTSGNIIFGTILGFGSAGLIVLNSVSAWVSWIKDLPQGYYEYQFFFFGWRTLSPGWRWFFLVWQIADTTEAVTFLVCTIWIAWFATAWDNEKMEGRLPRWISWALPPGSRIATLRFMAIPVGAALMMLFVVWPLILWVELIVGRNNIVSDTDWIAVWLFIAQVGTLLMPDPVPLAKWALCACWPSKRTEEIEMQPSKP